MIPAEKLENVSDTKANEEIIGAIVHMKCAYLDESGVMIAE